MKNKIVYLMIFFILFISMGCTNKPSDEFVSAYEQFEVSYIKATYFVELGNNYLLAVEQMDSELVENELKNMKALMDSISTELDTEVAEGLYGNIKTNYAGLEFLLYANTNYKNLTIEEKQRVYNECLLADTTRERLKEGKE